MKLYTFDIHYLTLRAYELHYFLKAQLYLLNGKRKE